MKKLIPLFASSFLFASLLLGTSLSRAQQQAQEILLPLERLVIETQAGSFKFEVEVADEEQERIVGLMFRTDMPANRGMLFDFGATSPIAMWMENTVLPLDMIFIEPNGNVLRIAQNTTPFSRDVITSGGAVSHVLEVNAGIAKQIGLAPGDRIIHADFKTVD